MGDHGQDKVGEEGGEVEVEVGPGEDRSLGQRGSTGGERWGLAPGPGRLLYSWPAAGRKSGEDD